jgi:hypothetical protein
MNRKYERTGMKKYIFSLVAVVFALLPAGCSSPTLPAEEIRDKPLASRLGDSIDISLAELLTKPRAELAGMATEYATRIQMQEQGRREGRLPFGLIPKLRLPLAVPVLREAQYSARAGFSLPPYLEEGKKDSGLAIHVARHGDSEAAAHLVEPGDAETSRQIQASRFEQNYPVEWTRLVGLLLHVAQMRLATGDVEGGTELVVLHRQLRAVLDPKAAQGTLGAVLLPRGRETLARAAAAWRADKKLELAAQADAALADWGDVPALTLPFQVGTPRAAFTRLLRSSGEGRTLAAPSIARAFDLLTLPFPDDGAKAVIACFDDADRLAELVITYRTGFGESFPEPALLALLLEERPLQGEDGSRDAGVRRRSYHLGVADCAVSVVDHGAGVGAIVQLGGVKESSTKPKLTRDFGGANLDGTFEQTRMRLTPEQRGATGVTIRGKALTQIRNPLPALQPVEAELRREKGQNLASALVLRYAVDAGGPPALHKLALPLWTTYGPAQFQGVSDNGGGHLVLIWEDSRTRYMLRSPYDTDQPVEFEIADRQGPASAERETAAAALERREREQRLKMGKPLVRIARYLEPMQIELGMRRSQVLQLLPPGQAVVKREIPGGLAITFRGEPVRTDPFVLRQMFIRFDNSGRVVEMRARYLDGPDAGQGRWMTDLLTKIKKRAGAPAQGPSPWVNLWNDLPPQKPDPLLCRWHDDITALVYQRDAAGVELALRDRAGEREVTPVMPPLEYLPRGPAKVQLGVKRKELLKSWSITKPVITEDGALVLRPPQSSPFDALLVWFDNHDQATRIVARHVPNGVNLASAAQWSQAILDAWNRELATLGWHRRQDLTANEVLQSLGWHDDRTRVRIFWQESDTGPPRLYTEWKELAP